MPYRPNSTAGRSIGIQVSPRRCTGDRAQSSYDIAVETSRPSPHPIDPVNFLIRIQHKVYRGQ